MCQCTWLIIKIEIESNENWPTRALGVKPPHIYLQIHFDLQGVHGAVSKDTRQEQSAIKASICASISEVDCFSHGPIMQP
jgi:hypothetical protein